MSVFRSWCMNHPMLLSWEGLREHIEMILLVGGTGSNYYVPLSRSLQSFTKRGISLVAAVWIPLKQTLERNQNQVHRVQLSRGCRLRAAETIRHTKKCCPSSTCSETWSASPQAPQFNLWASQVRNSSLSWVFQVRSSCVSLSNRNWQQDTLCHLWWEF